jgi:zinc transport system permease protein
LIQALFTYRFLQNAVLAALLASVVCGIIGVIIVEKKLVMMSGGIAHTAYGGVGLGYLLGFEPIWGALAFALAACAGIGLLRRKGLARPDVAIGLFWSLGMALGILFIGLTPGYPPQLDSYLFGSILAVTPADLRLMALLTALVAASTAALFAYWKVWLFDEEFAVLLGLPTACFEYLLLALIAVTVVALIRVVGIILALALLTAPAAAASALSQNLRGRMLWAVLLGAVFCLSGLWLSYVLNLASGASIVILSVFGNGLVYTGRLICSKLKKRGLALSGKSAR